MPALVARHHTVIAIDLPGLGDSSPSPDGYDERTVAGDLHRLVLQLGFHQVAVVGHDWGGAMAYAYAAAYPTEVSRLAILDVMLPGAGLG